MADSRGAIPERVRRALYGLSRGRCYAPECMEPMVVLDGDEPVFVGEVAHIVAAVASGPRGRGDGADREGFANLLLLCGRHHKIIDGVRTRDRYPVEVLREWKALREADLDAAALADLRLLDDLQARLPSLLTEVFRSTTSRLEEAVYQLEAADKVTHETARLLYATLAMQRGVGPGVGDGVPGIKEAFEEAYDAAGGASFLGLPSAEAYEIGPGVVQHLRGARCGHAAVICAITGRPAVIITADLWNAIAQTGGVRPGGGVYGAGFPSHTVGGDDRYLGSAVTVVPTVGGSWGPGVMRRVPGDRWKWIADLAFDANNAGNADTAFDSQSRLDLRLRLAAQIPLTQDDPRLTAAGRRRLAGKLAEPNMTAIVSDLAAGRVSVPEELAWQPRMDQFARNDSWGATYDCIVNAAEGRPAIRGTLQLLMPNLRLPQVTALVDLQVDFDGCQPESCQANTIVARRLTHRDIADFFTGAWSLAFDVLPAALGEPDPSIDPGDRTRVDLYVINERPQNTGGDRTFRLGDLVDLSSFGTTNKTYLDRLALGILGRGSLPQDDAREIVHMALVRAAEDAGFDRADLATW